MNPDTARRRRPLFVESGEVERETTERKNRRSKRNLREDEVSFGLVVLQVGTTLFFICCLCYNVSKWVWPVTNSPDNAGAYVDDHIQTSPPDLQEKLTVHIVPEEVIVTDPPVETAPPFPVWKLGIEASCDAYGIAEGKIAGNETEFWTIAADLRDEFSSRYGGENAARAMLQRGLSTFAYSSNTSKHCPKDLIHTACRILEAKDRGVFSMAFGGYSVTAGRGNKFSQAFPSVMGRILEKPFQLIGIELKVRNAAIGGIPSFPYGWCLKNFLGTDPDVISWDYSMNEAGGVPEGFEAYLRHSVTALQRRPKLIIKDTHIAAMRRDLLQNYTTSGIIDDPLLVHTDPAAEPFLNMQEKFRPVGFQDWRKWGAPIGAPGQSSHHPAKKEHEMIGWMIAMHFLSALELVAADLDASNTLNCPSVEITNTLPPPISVDTTKIAWSSILYGSAFNHTSDKWKIRPINCRTSFDPILNGGLHSIIISGTAADDIDIMLPKGHFFYDKGWVLDLSDKEKLAKKKIDRYDGLGFVDSKKAYYGLFESGPLQLLLPYEPQKDGDPLPNIEDDALSWFRSIVVCEVNEQRESGECKTETDVSYTIGGIETTKIKMIDTAGTLYIGKKLCMFLEVPEGAKIASRQGVEKLKNSNSSVVRQEILQEGEEGGIGLSLEIKVKSTHIFERKNACSVSHVVWEQTSL